MKPTAAIPAPLGTTNQTTESTSELQEQIRLRAYELYEQRGREDGRRGCGSFSRTAERS
jgi:hypothetical protein